MIWTKEEEVLLRKNYDKMSVSDLSKLLGRSTGAIRSKKTREGLVANKRWLDGKEIEQTAWTKKDVSILTEWYKTHTDELNLLELSKTMGRSQHFICKKARELKLTQLGRKPKWMIEELTERLNSYNKTDKGVENRKDNYAKMLTIVKTNHPKGMLGKTHTNEMKVEAGKRMKKRWEDMTEQDIKDMQAKQTKTRLENYKTKPPTKQTNPYSRTKSGKREDLNGIFFRSSWEANIARFFNYQKIEWEYEPKRFAFDKIKRGCISYMPDFYLPATAEWVEVKGWMDDKSKTRLKRFAKYYPEENAKLMLIDSKKYKEIENLYCRIIENWEMPKGK